MFPGMVVMPLRTRLSRKQASYPLGEEFHTIRPVEVNLIFEKRVSPHINIRIGCQDRNYNDGPCPNLSRQAGIQLSLSPVSLKKVLCDDYQYKLRRRKTFIYSLYKAHPWEKLRFVDPTTNTSPVQRAHQRSGMRDLV
jgi:hypothetical protein